MNFSENKSDRVALGNLSNTNSAFFSTSAINVKILDSNIPKRTKTFFDDANSSKKGLGKPLLNNIVTKDPENCPISPFVVNKNIDDINYTSTSLRDKDLSEKPKSTLKRKDLSKSPLTMLPLSQNTLNNKRPLRPSYEMDCAMEEKFSHSYFIQDELFMEDELKKKVKTVTNMISFPEAFQTLDCEYGIKLEQEDDNMVNFYEDFGIDLAFCNGRELVILLLI